MRADKFAKLSPERQARVRRNNVAYQKARKERLRSIKQAQREAEKYEQETGEKAYIIMGTGLTPIPQATYEELYAALSTVQMYAREYSTIRYNPSIVQLCGHILRITSLYVREKQP